MYTIGVNQDKDGFYLTQRVTGRDRLRLLLHLILGQGWELGLPEDLGKDIEQTRLLLQECRCGAHCGPAQGRTNESAGGTDIRPRFVVRDAKSGLYPDLEEIALHEEWADGLIYCDMEGFYLGEHGDLILADQCGNYRSCPPGRFVVEYCRE